MQVFVMVLNKTECLESILESMLAEGFSGATILNSTGMMRVLDGDDNVDLPAMGLLRHLYSPERKSSKTMFTLVQDDQVQRLTEIISDAVGGLDKPDTGIVFSMPISFAKGLKKNK